MRDIVENKRRTRILSSIANTRTHTHTHYDITYSHCLSLFLAVRGARRHRRTSTMVPKTYIHIPWLVYIALMLLLHNAFALQFSRQNQRNKRGKFLSNTSNMYV